MGTSSSPTTVTGSAARPVASARGPGCLGCENVARMPHPRPLPESLAGRPFTVSDALAAGVGRDRLDRSDLTAPFIGRPRARRTRDRPPHASPPRAPGMRRARVRERCIGRDRDRHARFLRATWEPPSSRSPCRRPAAPSVVGASAGECSAMGAGEVVQLAGAARDQPGAHLVRPGDGALRAGTRRGRRLAPSPTGWRRPGRWRLPHGRARIGEGSDGSEWPCPCSIPRVGIAEGVGTSRARRSGRAAPAGRQRRDPWARRATRRTRRPAVRPVRRGPRVPRRSPPHRPPAMAARPHPRSGSRITRPTT